MTQGSVEDDSSLKRSLRWKNRFTKSVQQQQPQQQREPTQPPPPPPHCLPAPGVNGSTSDVTWSSQTGCSDNNSIHSGTSSSDQQIPPCDDHIDESTLTKTRQSRNKDLHCYFKQVPPNDVLLHDFNCALQKDVLLQGRLFITQSFVGFKSNILGYVTTVELKIENIKHIDRVRTLRWMPRVLQVTMKNEDKYTFTSFLSSLSSARDEAYYCLLDLWQQQQQQNPQPSSVPFSSTSSLESTTSTTAAPPPPAPAKVVLPPSESTEIPDIESNRFNNADDDDDNSTAVQHTKDNPTTETTPHSPLSSPFKIFHRRRAQTVSASNDSPARARSMTSNSTPVARNTSKSIN
ncbi:hypothetical protein BC941DRAFT_97976 [Chlamydoabsidia padenii]|nr:hypothetical protein BC941DRAFT_97976 [Chlamydoabsidia padenii]